MIGWIPFDSATEDNPPFCIFKRKCHGASAMSYNCKNPEHYEGKPIGTGECVDFVKKCAGAPQTTLWKEGIKVKGVSIRPGTAIATFKDGKYANNKTGNHAAIYISQDFQGIWVWHQYRGKPVHKSLIQFKGGKDSPSRDGDAFSVIE